MKRRVNKESRSRDANNYALDIKTVKDAMPFGYTNIDVTAKDVCECIRNFSTLEVKRCVAPDCLKGIHTKIQLLCLSGTVPVKIEKSTYNIPISIYLKTDHPHSPPYCLVAPTNDMAIQPSRYVDCHGVLCLPYLNEWKHNKSNLSDLVQELTAAFEQQCPLYALSAALKVHLEIFDRNLSVKTVTFMTVRSNTAQGIKAMVQDEIQDKAGIPSEQQTLIYKGMVLENNIKMSDYNIPNEVTLQLVINNTIAPSLCPLVPMIALQTTELKQQLLMELQAVRKSEDANETAGDSTVERQRYVALQKRLADVEEKSVNLQQQLDAEKRSSIMLQARCEYLEDTVIANLTRRLEILEMTIEAKDKHWVIPQGQLRLGSNTLVTGGWGCVKDATYKGCRVAAKCLHDTIVLSSHNHELFDKEMKISANCHHQNLIQFIGAISNHPVIIVVELMDTNLRAALNNGTATPSQIHSIGLDVAQGLLYLHNIQPHPVIHCGVDASNVFLKATGNGWIAKLSDVGSARFIHFAQMLDPDCIPYIAPEIQQRDSVLQQTVKTDVYSYGVLLIEMLTGQIPTGSIEGLLRSVQTRWPQYLPLITNCTITDPNQRPSIEGIVDQLNTFTN